MMVDWCEVHNSQKDQGLKAECWRGGEARRLGYDDHRDCRMVSALLVTVSGFSPEAVQAAEDAIFDLDREIPAGTRGKTRQLAEAALAAAWAHDFGNPA